MEGQIDQWIIKSRVTHLLLTSTSRHTFGHGVKSVAISITSSIRERFTGFRTGFIIKLWKGSPTRSCFLRQGAHWIICCLYRSCISWKPYVKNNTYHSVTTGLWAERVSELFCQRLPSELNFQRRLKLRIVNLKDCKGEQLYTCKRYTADLSA